MDFNFNFREFLNGSRSTCRSKLDFAEMISSEVEAVSQINDVRTYMDRLIYKHQLELTLLAVKCGSFVNEGIYNAEIQDFLNRLED